MNGKDKCKQLKKYRDTLAKVNGIDFQTKECTFEGECPGYCPACDEEILLLEKKLQEKEKRGEHIRLYGLIKLAFKNGDKVHEHTPSYSGRMLGRIVDLNHETKKEPDEETNIDINEIIQKMFGNCPVDDEDGDDDDVETLLGDIIPPDDFNGGDW